jgi:ABC-type branched-subunit amino acid transport system substrate-binding protein
VASFAATEQRASVPNVFTAQPIIVDKYSLGPATYIKRTHPEVIKKAAMVYLSPPVTKNTAMRQMRAYQSIGYEFIYTAETQVVEANYTPYVVQMQSRGVEYITMVSSAAEMSRLKQAMRQQNWDPKVTDFTSTAYDPAYVQKAGQAAEGDFVSSSYIPYEEAAGSPEVQLYFRWLDKVKPGAKRDGFGLAAWSASRLFGEAMKGVGPNPTRVGLIEQLKTIKKWNGFGIQTDWNVGDKIPSDCFMYMEIKDAKFRRIFPDSGFACEGGLFNLK